MKLLIDKHGGMHYHKPDCKATKPIEGIPNVGHYEEIERTVRHKGRVLGKEYARIKVDGRFYYPCPFCFGHSTRKQTGG